MLQIAGWLDVSDDTLLRFHDLPLLPMLPRRRGNTRMAIPTFYRWSNRGVRGKRLRYVNVGGTRCTTIRWLKEFFEAVASAPVNGVPTSTTTSSTPRRSEDIAGRLLEGEGF